MHAWDPDYFDYFLGFSLLGVEILSPSGTIYA
jgi:hypothetical protein